MATVSSHTLNGVNGSHAGGIRVTLTNLDTGETLFDTAMDAGGRLMEQIGTPSPKARYELVFHTGPFWDARPKGTHGARLMDEIVVRFCMPDPEGRYHIPLILSPHATSFWCSTEHG